MTAVLPLLNSNSNWIIARPQTEARPRVAHTCRAVAAEETGNWEDRRYWCVRSSIPNRAVEGQTGKELSAVSRQESQRPAQRLGVLYSGFMPELPEVETIA